MHEKIWWAWIAKAARLAKTASWPMFVDDQSHQMKIVEAAKLCVCVCVCLKIPLKCNNGAWEANEEGRRDGWKNGWMDGWKERRGKDERRNGWMSEWKSKAEVKKKVGRKNEVVALTKRKRCKVKHSWSGMRWRVDRKCDSWLDARWVNDEHEGERVSTWLSRSLAKLLVKQNKIEI